MNVSYYNNDDDNDETTVFSAQAGVQPIKALSMKHWKVWYLIFIGHKCTDYLIIVLFFTEYSQSSLYVKMH